MKVKAVPEGFHTLTPYFSVREATRYVEFLKLAFGAREVFVAKFPDGSLLSAEVQVGDSKVVIGEMDTDDKNVLRSSLFMYVEDADAVFKKAVQAGAKYIQKPEDQFWGDRTGVLEDIAGNQWWIATHKEDMSAEELVRRAEKAYS